MIIEDILYGRQEIKEPVIRELINSSPIQRLKKISQFGIPNEYYRFPGFSRYEHSLGVMILLKSLGATLEEQIDGLIHDASHTAFSHIFDWITNNVAMEDSQDKNHIGFISKSEMPEILKRYNFKLNQIIKNPNHTLLEKDSPDLCADRLDYGLREFYYWLNKDAIKPCLENLLSYNGEIIFKNRESAKIFAENFLLCQVKHWSFPDAMVRYHIFSEMLKLAISRSIINIADFYKDDDYIINKLKSSNDKNILKTLTLMSGNISFEYVSENPYLLLKKKFRYVDPKYIKDNKIQRLSQADNEFRSHIDYQREQNNKGIKVNILS